MKHDQVKAPGADYWERAGEIGYSQAMYASEELAFHCSNRLWDMAIDIARNLGVTGDDYVLDLGCGDGAFANITLSRQFRKVDGFDISQAGIRRAQMNSPREEVQFHLSDITKLDFSKLPHYDCVFLIGILHHAKSAVPSILRGLRTVTDRVVVLEPNGSHILRRLVELTPAYRAAGEESFKTRSLEKLFSQSGFSKQIWQRRNLFPNFTPRAVYRVLLPFEPFFESTPGFRAFCIVNLWGLRADR